MLTFHLLIAGYNSSIEHHDSIFNIVEKILRKQLTMRNGLTTINQMHTLSLTATSILTDNNTFPFLRNILLTQYIRYCETTSFFKQIKCTWLRYTLLNSQGLVESMAVIGSGRRTKAKHTVVLHKVLSSTLVHIEYISMNTIILQCFS
ncbi:hypothetical protein D3C71_1531160 [compost metagenome]